MCAGWRGKGMMCLDWAEISLRSSHAEMELIAQALLDVGAGGVVYEDPEEERQYLAQAEGREAAPPQAEEPVVVKAYLPEDEDLTARLAELRDGIARLARAGQWALAHPADYASVYASVTRLPRDAAIDIVRRL